MDIKALQLESRFSLPPNSLGYCGKDTAPERFKKCIIEGDCDGVEKELTEFIVLHPYLKTLAEITSLPTFSYPIIESYWLGNDQLKKTKEKHYDLLLDNFITQGVPDFFVDSLRKKKPKKFIPTHFFQVLHIGVGQASGAVPFNIDSINNCMIRWGKVLEVKNQDSFSCHSREGGNLAPSNNKCNSPENKTKELKINLNSLKMTDGKYELCKKEEVASLNNKLVPGIKVGDLVAVHWNMVIKKLTKIESEKLEYWTNEVLNSALC